MEIGGLNLNTILEQVGREKNVDRKVLIEALEAAMLGAARKKLGIEADLEARFNDEISEVEVYQFKRIVAVEPGSTSEISFAEAKLLDPDLTEDAIGEDLGIKLDSREFGRIAAQNAKQIIVQKVREAERSVVYGEYKDRKGELVTGTVRRFERGNIIVDLGRAEAILPNKEQVAKENCRAGDRMVAYVLDVLESSRGAQIVLSRTHPNLVVKLFEQEVPEIADSVVSIEAVAREAGFRTKIIVRSKDSDVDPVGACVGMKGARVQAVVQELRGEKIDIVPFDADEARLVCNALAPAEVSRVLVNEGKHSMQIVVPDDQLSLAIGRRGQNVRLAAELTGWKIDISSETKVNEERDLTFASLSRIEGLTDFHLQTLYNYGVRSAQAFAELEESFLSTVPGFEEADIKALLTHAKNVAAVEQHHANETHLASRKEAELMLLLEAYREESLSQLAIAEVAMLEGAGFKTLYDVYVEDDVQALAEQTDISLPRVQEIRTEVSKKLHELSQGKVPLL